MEREVAPQGAQLISRAAEVLRAIPRGAPNGRRLRDLAASTGLTEPTVRRILLALIHEQFVVQDHESKLYRLGPLAFELGLASGFHARVVEMCRPHLRALASDTGDTSFLAFRSGMETVCLDRADGIQQVNAKVAEVGERLLLGVGTGGAVLLSTLHDAEIEEILAAPAYSQSQVSPDEIRARVALARSCGFADIVDKPIPGVRGIGVVVPTNRGMPTLALSIVATRNRLNEDHLTRILPILRMTAERVGAALDLH